MRTKKRSHAPSSWSVSCICVSAKIPPYTETQKGGLSEPVQGLRLRLQSEHEGVRDAFLSSAAACRGYQFSAAAALFLFLFKISCLTLRRWLGVAAFIKQMKLSFQKIIAKQQINSSSWGTWMRCSGSLLGGQSRQSGSEAGLQPSARLNHNMWPLSQHGWDWLLFTEECLCSTTEQEGKYLSDVKLT